MSNTKVPFKNTYVINMKALAKQPEDWTMDGKNRFVPIESKNGVKPTTPNESTKAFSGRFVARMIQQYDALSAKIGTGAATIIEYIDLAERPVITLFPNNDIDLHNDRWVSWLESEARQDFLTTYNRHKTTIESVFGKAH